MALSWFATAVLGMNLTALASILLSHKTTLVSTRWALRRVPSTPERQLERLISLTISLSTPSSGTLWMSLFYSLVFIVLMVKTFTSCCKANIHQKSHRAMLLELQLRIQLSQR